MFQRQGDPFFEQLRVDVQAGVAAADRGELVDDEMVWRELEQRVSAIEEQKLGHRGPEFTL